MKRRINRSPVKQIIESFKSAAQKENELNNRFSVPKKRTEIKIK